MQARIGAQEARAADGLARAEARAASLQIIRTELLEADPYETATALESATQRLDALYLVTARLSRLSLTEYLR
jgi:flagellar hook-associated protein 3 FlgL